MTKMPSLSLGVGTPSWHTLAVGGDGAFTLVFWLGRSSPGSFSRQPATTTLRGTLRQMAASASADWEGAHPPGPDGVPSRLYTDEDPVTTIKGMGFRDAAAATRTIHLALQPGALYKTYWCVRAMAERARRHPAQTPGMRAALVIFDDWLKEHRDRESQHCTPEQASVERHQRAQLAATRANAHAFSRCSSVDEFNRLASEDRADALRRLRAAHAGSESFVLPATRFVSLFGGPAIHGYGEHICVQARSQGLPVFRCVCGMEGNHVVIVHSANDLLGSGGFRWPSFELSISLDGELSRATLKPTPPPGQPTLHASLMRSSTSPQPPTLHHPAPAIALPPTTAATHAGGELVDTGSALHVVLLRRDLRIDDQPALARAAAAASADPRMRLIICYVYDPILLRHPTTSTAHYFFIDDCLAEVQSALSALGSALVLRSGNLCGVLESFRKLGFRTMTLWSNRVVGVAAERRRDAQVASWCKEHGIAWHDIPANGVIPHEECSEDWRSDDFQAFWSHEIEEHCWSEEESLPSTIKQRGGGNGGSSSVGDGGAGAGGNGGRLPPPPEGLRPGTRLSIQAIARLGASSDHGIARERCQRGGSSRGRELLASFLNTRGFGYRSKLSSPVTAPTSCSRLSPHLAWGTLSLRQVHRALRVRGESLVKQKSATAREWLMCLEGFRMRLHWRSHNMQKFEAMPNVEHSNVMAGYDHMRDETKQTDEELRLLRGSEAVLSAAVAAGVAPSHPPTGQGISAALTLGGAVSEAELETRFHLWAAGRTGYPLVDACMRCLDATGWLTFRMRCLCVSFACYHLWLHWRRPAIWLARRFVDFEPGIHFCQMQMQAGCAEYVEMRVYNPIKQAAEQDPKGAFIREWLPELRTVPLQYLHEPGRMPKAVQREVGCVLGVDYPRPIVEHQPAYERAKHALQERRNAMGWAPARGDKSSGRQSKAVAAGRADGGEGSRDIRSLLGEKRPREEANAVDAGAHAELQEPAPSRWSPHEDLIPPTPGETPPAEVAPSDAPAEMRTKAVLVAAGFPPEVARRAASAYPTDVERAADWILASNEW